MNVASEFRFLLLFLLLCALPFSTSMAQAGAQSRDTLSPEAILRMSFLELMNVKVTTATKTPERVGEVAASVQVITAEQIRQRGYFTLEEALGDLPGFQFRNIMGFNSYVFLRGVPSQNNLILLLVDGVQINELNSGGFYAGGQFNMADVERIEVVYGPASALYGTNAVSGIVHVITRDHGTGTGGHVSLLGGSFATGLLDFGVHNYLQKADVGFSLSGMLKTSEKGDLSGSSGEGYWTDDMENFEDDLSLLARVRVKNLTAGVLYQEKKSSMTTQFLSQGDVFLDRNTLWDISFMNAYLRHRYEPSERWALLTSLYYRNSTVNDNSVERVIRASGSSLGYQLGYYRPNDLGGAELQWNYQLSSQLRFTAGVVGELEHLAEGPSLTMSNSQDSLPPRPPRPGMLTNRLFGYYGQLHWDITGQLSFIGGLRHDFSSYYGQVVTPRLGLVYHTQDFSAKLMYNKAFRSPRPWDYTYGTGNSDLQPEKMRSIELGVSWNPVENLALGTALFRNRIYALLTRDLGEDVDRWINKDRMTTLGAEVFARYQVGMFSVFGNYSYNNSEDQDGGFIPEIALHTANAGVTWMLSGDLSVSLRSNYQGNRRNPFIIPSTGDDRLDDALLFHGTVTITDLFGLECQLKVNNILNTEYYHPSNRFAGRYRQAQRAFSLKLTYRFERD